MRSIRTKKIKNQTNKYLMGPFDQSLVQIQLDKNEKCIQELGKNHFEKVTELLRQIKTDCELISDSNREKYVIKALTLNTEAYFRQKQMQYEQALSCLKEAEQLQTEHKLGPIEIARTKLNKSVILSHLGGHEQSIQLGREALELLQRKKEWQLFELHKNQYKLYEIMTVSFYNIACELTHLKDNKEAAKVYKEGYYLAQRTLGPSHRLTLLLKSILKEQTNKLSKQKNKDRLEVLKSNRSESKSIHNINFLSNDKEKELKRIYASKKKKHESLLKGSDNPKEVNYYLKSLQKVKGLYSKRQKEGRRRLYTTTNGENNLNLYGSTRLMQADEMRKSYQGGEHHKIKDIILNGRPINRNKIYCSERSKTQITQPERPVNKFLNLNQSVALEPIATAAVPQSDPKSQQPPLKLSQIAQTVNEKNKEQGSQCQLI